MTDFNTKILKKIEQAITPYLKDTSAGKNTLEKEVGTALTTYKPTYTLVSQIKGHIKQKNKEETDYLILGLENGTEKIHVYQDKLLRSEAGSEILNCQYQNKVVYLDFQKLYKLKTLVDIRYEQS